MVDAGLGLALTRRVMPDAPLILLVDDFEDALDMYREYLIFRGYRVISATNGSDALDMFRARRPDLILLDLRMPGLSGLDVVRILRADEECDGCPIVALTAHALEEERTQAFRAGFDEVISKPCLPDVLVQNIERLLQQRTLRPLVLIATDVEDQRKSYTAALEDAGFQVYSARTGADALAVARQVRPACAVVDLRLPDMSGWDTCRRLKAQPENTLTRIIVLTQRLTADAADGEVKVGCHAWLMQPTVAQDLLEAVRDVLRSRRDRPESPGEALIGVVPCPACGSQDVRAGVRVGAVQYYCCQNCRLCWRVEPASTF